VSCGFQTGRERRASRPNATAHDHIFGRVPRTSAVCAPSDPAFGAAFWLPRHDDRVFHYVSSGLSSTAVIGHVNNEREDALRNQLLGIDATLRVLADEATRHAGDEFAHWPLKLFEEAREISGRASAQAGDVWFEICNVDADRWEVSAAIPVHCDLMPRGYSCTHDLFDQQRVTASPEEAVELLASLVADVREQLPGIPIAMFHRFPHVDFPD
jgi:hypothetical protein